MTRLLLALTLIVGCTDATAPVATRHGAQATVPDAGDEAFVRRIVPALWGRHPTSLAEVEVLLQVLAETGREGLVRAMARSPEYLARWAPFIRDTIAAERIGARSNELCYGVTGGPPDPGLAAHVRDNPPGGPAWPEPWTVADLIGGALALDDLSPVWRAHLFGNLHLDYDLPDLAGARAARQARAEVFARSHLGRRLECLDCHNSEASVTDHADPEADRFWPLEGLLERSVFGRSVGVTVAQLRPFFRRRGVVAGVRYEDEPQDQDLEQEFQDGAAPWGIHEACGRFFPALEVWPDDLDSQAYLARSIGAEASVWQLEAALDTGLDQVRDGLAPSPGGDQALAWLIASTFAERVWEEVLGHPLTIDHGFPRHPAQREALEQATRTFATRGFSLVSLLVEITTGPWFNRPLPAAGAEDPQPFPALFDPWVDDGVPNTERRNGPGDLVRRRSGRVLLRAVQTALELTPTREFPLFTQSPEARLYQDVGVYLKEGNPGFNDSTFQGLLAWESTFGACRDLADLAQCPFTLYLGTGAGSDEIRCETCAARSEACEWDPRCCDAPWEAVCEPECLDTGEPDAFGLSEIPPYPAPVPETWIDRLLAAAWSTEGATLGDAAGALKDRLLADPVIQAEEAELLGAVAGRDLATPLTGGPEEEEALRRVCGVLLATPQFLLTGNPGPDRAGSPPPAVQVPGSSFQAVCEALAPTLLGDGAQCNAGRVIP